MGDEDRAGNGPAPGTGVPQGSGLGWAFASGRRRAMRQMMRPPQIKHGLVKAPHINHPRDSGGPKFGVGGGWKASGF